MRKTLVITLLVISFLTAHSQTSSDILKVHDTRDINDAPNSNTHAIRADFKLRKTIGVPGNGNFSTSLTISPWGDDSGDFNHQLNFNNGGIYYRIGTHSSQTWNRWQKMLTEDSNGNVGIGIDNPLAKLDVDGDVKIGLHTTNWSGYGRRLTLSGVGDYTDDMWLAKYCRGENMTDLRVNIGDDPHGIPAGMDRFIIGTTTPYQSTDWQSHFTVESNGNVGIGTENPQSKLDVSGTIRAKEVKIEATGWSDFVFDKNYNLPKLSDVEKHINDKQHLPGIPSEKEVLENGVNVVDMQAKLLQKIEELTLYVINQDKQNKDLQKQVNELKVQLNERQP